MALERSFYLFALTIPTMIVQRIKSFTQQLKDVTFDINSSWVVGALTLSASVTAVSLATITLQLGPISRQAKLWNICVQEEIKHLPIMSATKRQQILFSVPHCNGSTN